MLEIFKGNTLKELFPNRELILVFFISNRLLKLRVVDSGHLKQMSKDKGLVLAVLLRS